MDTVQSSDEMQSHEFVLQDPEETSYEHTYHQLSPTTALQYYPQGEL